MCNRTGNEIPTEVRCVFNANNQHFWAEHNCKIQVLFCMRYSPQIGVKQSQTINLDSDKKRQQV